MRFLKPKAKTALERVLLKQVENDTPEKIRNNKLIDLNEKDQFTFTISNENLQTFKLKGDSLGISDWFDNYVKEAKVSTAGIRGLQNPLYPWDTRYPLNLVGMMLATLGKIMVANDTDEEKYKIVASEVRYNSPEYVELIARIQAAYGINTYVIQNYETIPIFLISFIIFMYDLYGGEYVTSSHAMCKKIATKDLNTQGSQYIPDETLKFTAKVQKILDEAEKKGSYTIKFSSKNDIHIDSKFMKDIKNGIGLYTDYLKMGVATKQNILFIKNLKNKLIIECMGGSMYKTLMPLLKNLEIDSSFTFLHKEEDSFNHGIGKEKLKNGKFFDWGCDTTMKTVNLKTLDIELPVVKTIGYNKLFKKYPVGTTILMTDPDADRLVTSFITSKSDTKRIKEMGLAYIELEDNKILVVLMPNQSFLMNIDFHKSALEKEGLWKKYDWFILKTTASQRSWDEWAQHNNVPVINTPVGFKELADTMQQIEKKLIKSKGKNIIIKDVFGRRINIGKKPRLFFAGEESGGMIVGPSEIIKSKKGRLAISMREKSAGEAIIITSAMVGWLESRNISVLDYLEDIFERNKIKSKYEIRVDQKYYNESEPDINKLLKDKKKGMEIKTKNNSYFLSLALGYKDGLIDIQTIKKILSETFPDLQFSNILSINFVGDGTFILFDNKAVEVRPSGTDAVNKAYAYGVDQWDCIKYAQQISAYKGERTQLHKKYIKEYYYSNIEDYSFKVYMDYKKNQ